MIPQTLLQPPWFPPSSLQPLTPTVGPASHLVRLARLIWTVWVGLPLVLWGGILLALGVPALPAVEGRRLLSNVTIPFISNLVWALSSGHVPATQPNDLPFRFPPAVEGVVPRVSAYFFSSASEDGLQLRSKGVLLDSAPERACVGAVKTGFGRVKRRAVPATWLWKDGSDDALGSARPSEQVILYFVGGGYVSGTSLLGPFPWSLLRAAPTNARLLGVQYRHAVHQECAFPAALQDGLAAWHHLVVDCGFAPKDIVVTGDSAGAGLSWSLTAYLSLVDETLALGVPGRVALFSPWLDLSLSHPGLIRNTRTDLLNLGQITIARDCYLHNILTAANQPFGPAESIPAPELLQESSFLRLQAGHPLYSPGAAAMAVSHLANGDARSPTRPLDEILCKLQANGTRLLVQYGSAEVFANETEAFLDSVASASNSSAKPNGLNERPRRQLDVVSLVEQGGWHCNATMFPPWNGRSLAGRILGIGAAESRACGAFGAWLEVRQDNGRICNGGAHHPAL